MKRFVCVCMLLVSVPPHLPAQEDRLDFDRLSIGQGLSQCDVKCILQDRQGFMWFGTEDGLNQYDGYAFTVFRHSAGDPGSISDNMIDALAEDDLGNLWAGTSNGLNEFDRETGKFRRFMIGPGEGVSSAGNRIYSLCAGPGHSLLVGTAGRGLLRLVLPEGRIETVPIDPAPILSTFRDREGNVWVGTEKQGLVELDPACRPVARYSSDPGDDGTISQNDVQCVAQDRRGELWVGTNFGLNRFDRTSGRFRRYLFGDDSRKVYTSYIFSIHEDESGGLWIGTDEGVELYDRQSDTFRRVRDNTVERESSDDDPVFAINDGGGAVWLGTNRGLKKYGMLRKSFRNYRHVPGQVNSLSDDKVWSVYCDGRGVLWVGSYGGLDEIDRRTGRYRHYRHDASVPSSLSNNSIMAILEDRSGTLWLGTWGGGLDKFDRATGTFAHVRSGTPDSLFSRKDAIQGLCEDEGGRLWLGTGGGLLTLDLRAPGPRTLEGFPLHLPGGSGDFPPCKSVIRGSGEEIWAGTYEGLIRLEPGTNASTLFRHRSDAASSLSHDWITSIHRSAGGRIFVGTLDGLNLFDPATGGWSHFTAADGLPNGVINGILEDGRGVLWLSTNKGISSLDPASRKIRNYDTGDGLQSDEFNEHASYKSPSGEMFFGGIDGLTSFFPDSLRDNPRVPPVVLTSLNVGGRIVGTRESASGPGELRLSPAENSFAFEFAALDYTRPEKNRYAYMLEGFDREWVYSGTRRYASYTNLDPGSYTLRLKGSNNDGVWNERGIALRLVIAPPFWKTWWFRAAALLSLVSIAAAGYVSRMKAVRKRNRDLELKIEERTSQLAVTNESLRTEVLERKRTENELWRLKQQLEQQVRQRTSELSTTVSSLEQQVAARELAERNLLAYQEKLRLLASDLSTTEERERRRLSTYLHDSIGQTLAFCKIKLGTVQRSARLAGSDARLKELLGMIEQSIADTRRLTLELSPPILHELGLVAAIDWLCARIGEQHGIRFTVEEDPRPLILEEDLGILLFHAVREAVVNIVKHAKARRGTVRIGRTETCVTVEVEDDGRGFDASRLHDHAVNHDGFGLFNMRERVQSLGGSLRIESDPERGTRLRLTVPLPAPDGLSEKRGHEHQDHHR